MSETVLAAMVGAIGIVLAALIARSDRRADHRHDALARQMAEVDARVTALDGALRFGLQEVTGRIDDIYGLMVKRPVPDDHPEAG